MTLEMISSAIPVMDRQRLALMRLGQTGHGEEGGGKTAAKKARSVSYNVDFSR